MNVILNASLPINRLNHFGLLFQAMKIAYTGTLVRIIRTPYPVSTGLAIIGTMVTKTVANR